MFWGRLKASWRFIFFGLCSGLMIFQLIFALQIASWLVIDPGYTAFMRAERWRLCGVNIWSCELKHEWMPYEKISRHLKRAIIASEDSGFAFHDGFELDAMLNAWSKNKKRGKFVAGGSTITQQLAKNLFLSSEKSYVRKAEEVVITGLLELFLDKERIFEIYLNSVEWGEGIFGAEAAARYYFKTSAAQLSPPQAARLAAALPAPKCFDKRQYCKNIGINFHKKAGIIAGRMGAAALPD
jgi:monofunctional glycosyltransferase